MMDRITYLKQVIEAGKAHMAPSPALALEEKSYHGVDSFQGLYWDLAEMEIAAAEGRPAVTRDYILEKGLNRLDTRLDCADFVIPALLRMLFAHKGTNRLSDEMAEKIQNSLISFKYWLDEPGEIHACFFTENHQVLFHSAEYLAGQLFPDAVFPNNGMTGKEHKAHGEQFLRRWLCWRLRFGFAEWLTQGYYMDDILGLVNLMIYAEDQEIREKSRMLIDLLCLDLALHGFRGHLPTTHGRVYTGFIIDPDQEDCSHLMRFLFDEGSNEGLCGAAVMLAAVDYRCPQAILNIYKEKDITIRQRMSVDAADAAAFGVDPKDFDNIMFFWGMQTYSDRVCIDNSLKVFPQWNWMTNRVRAYKERYDLCDEAGAPCPDAPDFTAMTEVNIYTKKTEDYILSCAQDFRKGRMGYQQHPWTASLGGKAVIFTTNPASLEYQMRPNRWAGNLCLPKAVQHENVLFCMYRILPDFVDFLNSHLYFPKHEMDETRERDGFIFGRKGKAYIAVTAIGVGRQYWEEKDPAFFRHVYGEKGNALFEKATEYEYMVQGHATVWAVEMGSEKENGSFENFMAGFRSGALRGDTHNFAYQSPSLGEMRCGWGRPLSVAGREIAIRGYGRYDTPYVKADFDARKMEIACGGSSLALDFEGCARREK
ncbi:MAG: hypothetical protein IJD39_06420 [Clostridia bacterium]|nr:hypothetical protein [Clostridia bacterium]